MHLRCELVGHQEDVRGLCVCPLGLVSCSRDKTIKIWKELSATEFEVEGTLVGHTDFVTALTWMAAGLREDLPEGGLVSGSRDKTVVVWDHLNKIPAHILEGHEYQVSSVATMEDGGVVSGSLDRTLRIWKGNQTVATLAGHEGPVLCMVVLPDNYVLSGSGDKTMRLWKDGQLVKTFTGHADTVRDLAFYPNVGIVSASHDHTLRVWTLDANCVGQLVGHTGLVYACASSSNGLIASGSEDNTAKVWRADGTIIATLRHPGCVWAVAFLPNEDLVTGCSDGIVRVWSADEQRKASDDAVAALEQKLDFYKQNQPSGQGGSAIPAGLNIENPAVLLTPGTKDGQTKIVKEESGAVVYGWNAQKNEWEKIGDVMGDQGGEMSMPSKTYHNGREWDYVFDVDVQDGAPMLKLCMNHGDNPHLAAERFLIENRLPTSYLDQVIQFILAKTEHMPIPNADPLTGGSSFIPEPQTRGPAHAHPSNISITGGGFDPLTGDGGTVSKKLHYCPKQSCIFFNMVRPVAPMIAKIIGFNSELGDEDRSVALTESESTGVLEALINKAVNSTSENHIEYTDVEFVVLQKLMRFPHHQLFPVLDVCRMMALDVSAQGRLAAMAGDLTSKRPGVLGSCILNSDAGSGQVSNQQMALQFLCNCFKHPNLRAWVINNRYTILENYRLCCEASARNTRQALSTLVLNIGVEFHSSSTVCNEDKEHALGVAIQVLSTIPKDDFESGFRALVAAGTLVHNDLQLAAFGKLNGILVLGQQWAELPGVPTKIREVVEDLRSLID